MIRSTAEKRKDAESAETEELWEPRIVSIEPRPENNWQCLENGKQKKGFRYLPEPLSPVYCN